MPDAQHSAPQVEELSLIEVGEIELDGLRLWCAREARRLAELSLDAQTKTLDRAMTRATSVIGWSSVAATGVSSAIVAHTLPMTYLAPVGLLAGSAIAALVVLLPGKWVMPGDQSGYVMGMPYSTELEITEALALRTEAAERQNAPRIKRIHRALRASYALLALASLLSAALTF